MRAWILWLLVGVFISAPSAAASPQDLCVITILPNSEFSEVVVRVDEIYNQSRKMALANDLDVNQDETIEAYEETEYERASRLVVYDRARGEYREPELGEKRLYLDDKYAHRIEFRTELANVVGPANDTDDWLITEVRTFAFESERLHTHRILGGNESHPEPRAIVEFVVAKAPDGWLVHRVNDTLYDKQEVSLAAFDTRRFFTVDYSDSPGLDYTLPANGGPGFGAWAVAAALFLALGLGSRRGRRAERSD